MDGTIVSSIVVAICGVLGTWVATRGAVDRKRAEDDAKAVQKTAADLAMTRARLEVAREHIAELRVVLISEGHDPPAYPEALKRLK